MGWLRRRMGLVGPATIQRRGSRETIPARVCKEPVSYNIVSIACIGIAR